MKLNYKRTILIGMAFLSICAFWQLYDNVVPLILKNTFDLGDDVAGAIMGIDNVLALFLLPFFGKLSDRANTRLGKRTPFVIGGTVAAVILMNLLPIADKTANLAFFVVALGLLLIAMGTYRSPAVALMPDLTPKPLRSKGNAMINLMGALGGVFTLAVTSVLVSKDASGKEDYTLLFVAVSILMVIAVIVLVLTISEKKILAEVAQADKDEVIDPDENAKNAKDLSALSPEMRKSLILILASVSLWFMGYNAVTTAFTKYVSVQWNYGLGAASQCLMVATVGAVLSYIPVGMLSSKYGRKRIIQIGVLLLAGSFAGATAFSSFHPVVYVLFLVVGASWAMINVNSYPMVVEISRGTDVGKYTGYYYAFSMGAQALTPYLSGLLLRHVGYHTLFPYAAIMVALSFVTISLTKHGDNRPEPPQSKLEAFDVGDD